VRGYFTLFLQLACVWVAGGQTAPAPAPAPAPADAQALLNRALANELRAAQDPGHPMRYRLCKTSPRLASTKLIIETKDGLVARLISINGQPLSEDDEKKEQSRLDGLLTDPARQHHRKASEVEDAARALKVLRELPRAFLYQLASGDTASGQTTQADAATAPSPAGAPAISNSAATPASSLIKYTFKPNPAFDPPDLETELLTQMKGDIWIDPTEERVTHLEGHLQQDVDFGWGILGRLNKGGWIAIEQADVGAHQWRVVHFKMQMSGRLLIKTKVFDTSEDETDFAPVPVGLDYQKAIEMLRAKEAEVQPPQK
jgi:hypothetical protein